MISIKLFCVLVNKLEKGAKDHGKTPRFKKMARAGRKRTKRQTSGIPGLAYAGRYTCEALIHGPRP
jgi:hypothetical protein